MAKTTFAMPHLNSRSASAPTVGSTWSNIAWGYKDDTSGHVIDTDMFNTDESKIGKYKNEGHYVICYIDVGSTEKGRPDTAQLEPYTTKSYDGFEGEKWLDITSWQEFKSVMEKRFEMAKSKGCQGIEADNTDCYNNNCVSGVSKEDLIKYQIEYLEWIATTIHKKGMTVALKNTDDLIEKYNLADKFDYAINEQCENYGECNHYDSFFAKNKAVFGVNYKSKDSVCNNEYVNDKKIMMKYKAGGDKWGNCWD